jgi:hypothetical protein
MSGQAEIILGSWTENRNRTNSGAHQRHELFHEPQTIVPMSKRRKGAALETRSGHQAGEAAIRSNSAPGTIKASC